MRRFPISSADFSVHCHATEDEGKILKAMETLLPKGAEIKRTVVEGHHGNPIIIFSSRVCDENMLEEIWRKIVETLGREKTEEEVREKMDESCSLSFRFDKQAAFGGALKLSSGEEPIKVKLKVTAYPARPDIAVKNLLETVGAIRRNTNGAGT
ncbi:MAG: RNA-binding domain-containing protein [Candidatus Hadarchaeales archaeon]